METKHHFSWQANNNHLSAVRWAISLAAVCCLSRSVDAQSLPPSQISPQAPISTQSLSKLQIAPGVLFTQEITTGEQPIVVNCLHVDLTNPTVHVKSGQAQDQITLNGPTKGREQLHSLTVRDGTVASVNADFFPFTGDPLGLEVRDGELLSEPTEYRVCFGLSRMGVLMDVLAHYGELDLADGSQAEIAGINRQPQGGEIVVLTPSYAATPKLGMPALVITLQDVNLPVKVSKLIEGTIQSIQPLSPNTPLPQSAAGTLLLVATGSAVQPLIPHLQQGQHLKFRLDLVQNGSAPLRGKYPSRGSIVRGKFSPVWSDVEQAVGGGPWLVKDGTINIDWESEGLSRTTFVEKRHPRTAAGITRNGTLLLVTVDGRSPSSQGVTLAELAAIMKRLDAVNAMNFDGGGSSTMVVGGLVVNGPSDGRERPIADALLVYSDSPAITPNPVTLPVPVPSSFPAMPASDPPANAVVLPAQPLPQQPLPAPLHAGDPFQVLLPADSNAAPIDAASILWGTMDGLGFVNQRGLFMSTHVGKGMVLARFQGKVISIPVSIEPASASIVKATLTSIPNYPPYYGQLTITVTDRFGNPIPGIKLSAEMTGGKMEDSLVTAPNGQITGQIVWDVAPEKRVVRLSCLALKQVTVRQKAATVSANNVSQDPDDRP